MQSSIVCGVDGSRDSKAVVAVAAELAKELDARLVLAHVTDHALAYAVVGPLATMPRPAPRVTIEAVNEAAEQLLADLAEAVELDNVEQRVVSGNAAERLAELAEEEAADLIVVGSRGRGAFKAAFLGSVSNELIGLARCPVLVIPRSVHGS